MRRHARTTGVLALLLVIGCYSRPVSSTPTGASASAVRMPRDAARFEIDAVDDSTVRFRRLESRWLRPGMLAVAVDPRNRDALVARLRLVYVDSAKVTALVTGQVSRVTTSHFLLVARPQTRWFQNSHFWLGAVAGAAVGTAATSLSR